MGDLSRTMSGPAGDSFAQADQRAGPIAGCLPIPKGLPQSTAAPSSPASSSHWEKLDITYGRTRTSPIGGAGHHLWGDINISYGKSCSYGRRHHLWVFVAELDQEGLSENINSSPLILHKWETEAQRRERDIGFPSGQWLNLFCLRPPCPGSPGSQDRCQELFSTSETGLGSAQESTCPES